MNIRVVIYFSVVAFLIPLSGYSQNNCNFPLNVSANQDLDFGNVLFNSGVTRVGINSANKSTVSINGIGSFEVLVEITADTELLLNGNPSFSGVPSKSIPYTLEAAYQNQGLPASQTGAATLFTVTNNMASDLFKIDETAQGPSSPPGNCRGNPNFAQGTAFVYLYGSISVGNVSSGDYTGKITVSVTYN